jgi:hypothetical protein
MRAEERTIGNILTEQICYEIPPYQRPVNGKVKVYQFWENKNVPPLMLNTWFMMICRSQDHPLAGCKSVC